MEKHEEQGAEAAAVPKAPPSIDWEQVAKQTGGAYVSAMIAIGTMRRQIESPKNFDRFGGCLFCARNKSFGHLESCLLVASRAALANYDEVSKRMPLAGKHEKGG